MAAALAGAGAPLSRRDGCALMIAAAQHTPTAELAQVRAAMTGVPSNFSPPAELLGSLAAWRRVQIRQLFRLISSGTDASQFVPCAGFTVPRTCDHPPMAEPG
jgi:hypothetical protein